MVEKQKMIEQIQSPKDQKNLENKPVQNLQVTGIKVRK